MDSSDTLDSERLKSGLVAVVGAANAGKSTLMNRLAEEKVSIVSPVAQTTRNTVRVIFNDDRGQLAFLDTPGVHKAQSPLGQYMNRLARQSVEGADVCLLMLDQSEEPRLEAEGWMRRLLFADLPVVACLNKSEEEPGFGPAYQALWKRLQAEKDSTVEAHWVASSAQTGEGVEALLTTLFLHVPVGPKLFPDDLLTDYPRKWAVADAIREQYFCVLKDELPHALAVRVDAIHETGSDWTVEATVFVDRPSQKGIVIGNKGRLLKKVQRLSADAVADMYGLDQVEIRLWVKVEKNWSRNYFLMKELGYTAD